MDILHDILKTILLAAIPVLTAFLCALIKKGMAWLAAKSKSETESAYYFEIDEAVRAAVTYVNQTFVDALKADASFDEEQQEAAFNEAYQTAIQTISDAALDFLSVKFGDIRQYLTVKIEEAVHQSKRDG